MRINIHGVFQSLRQKINRKRPKAYTRNSNLGGCISMFRGRKTKLQAVDTTLIHRHRYASAVGGIMHMPTKLFYYNQNIRCEA